MINDVLVFLKNRLNTHFSGGLSPDESLEDQVVFLDGQIMDSLTFKLGAVSVLLINLEEENVLRNPDLYAKISPNGSPYKSQPDIRLNLYVLFVAHYKQYEDSLKYLSLIISYFQTHRVIDQHDAMGLKVANNER